jgi:hypothetical protein
MIMRKKREATEFERMAARFREAGPIITTRRDRLTPEQLKEKNARFSKMRCCQCSTQFEDENWPRLLVGNTDIAWCIDCAPQSPAEVHLFISNSGAVRDARLKH